jgi:outer membrane protein OmpA-like peptidoglycan-associated protein
MNFRILILMLIVSILTACTGTTVVLVPDAGGNVGQVELITEGGTTVLTKAYESAEATKEKQAPTKTVQLSDEKVHDMFADTLAKEPLPPEHFLFHFKSGSADLLTEANEELAKTKAVIEARKSCDLSVIGHTDRVDDISSNYVLSMHRADNVAKALTDIGIARECLDIRFYGENYPVVPTDDDVDEPRNRRVEIEVR